MPDYGEIFCNAVSEIVSKELIGLSYDFSQVCEIVDISERYKGVYRVKTGEAKFQAYSSITTYEVGDIVYVITPNNNINEQRIIIAKKAMNEQPDVAYVMPFNNLTIVEENIINKTISKGLVANNENTSEILLWSSSTNNLYSGYTRLGLQGQFRSIINSAIEGGYGLKLVLYAGDRKEPVAVLILDSSDMYGNPYEFNGYIKQQKIFDISELPAFNRAELYFYQENNFIDKERTLIPYKDNLDNLNAQNIFISEPVIALGYDANDTYNKGLILYSPQSLYYNEEGGNKELKWRFIRTLNNKKAEMITDMNKLQGYRLLLYKYQQNSGITDVFGGTDWIPVKKNDDILENFDSYIFSAQGDKESDKFKAFLIFNNKIMYESNTLEFKNIADLVSMKVEKLMNTFQITCLDESDGIYNLYDEKNVLTSGGSKVRYLAPQFKDSDGIYSSIPGVKKIKWTIPKTNTMISLDIKNLIDLNSIENNGNKTNFIENFIEENYLQKIDEYTYNVSYYTYGDYYYIYILNPGSNVDNQKLKYKINETLIANHSNNTVICELFQKDLKLVKEKTFLFGLKNSQDYTVEVSFKDMETDGFTIEESNTIKDVILKFFNPKGEEVNLEDYDVNWYWYGSDATENINKILFDIIGNLEDTSLNKLGVSIGFNDEMKTLLNSLGDFSNVSSLTDISKNGSALDNYSILVGEAILKNTNTDGSEYKYRALLPISLSLSENKLIDIEGAGNVIYNQNGSLETTFNEIIAKFLNNEIDSEDLKVLIGSSFNLDDYIDKFQPILDEITGQLKPTNTYIENLKAIYSFIVSQGENILKMQPFAAVSQDFFSSVSQGNILNFGELPGTYGLRRDASGNEPTSAYEIISSNYSAGKINDKQEYTGVIMGQVINNNKEKGVKKHGLYGFKNDEMTFSIDEDGDAYFKGTVEASSGYFTGDITGASGTFNGEIVAKNGSVGGWEIKSNLLKSPDNNQNLTIELDPVNLQLRLGNIVLSPNSIIVPTDSTGENTEEYQIDIKDTIIGLTAQVAGLEEVDKNVSNALGMHETRLNEIDDSIKINENKWPSITFIDSIKLNGENIEYTTKTMNVLAYGDITSGNGSFSIKLEQQE